MKKMNQQDTPIIKVLGILNSDWNHIQDIGQFEHGNNIYKLESGDFIVFDPRVNIERRYYVR